MFVNKASYSYVSKRSISNWLAKLNQRIEECSTGFLQVKWATVYRLPDAHLVVGRDNQLTLSAAHKSYVGIPYRVCKTSTGKLKKKCSIQILSTNCCCIVTKFNSLKIVSLVSVVVPLLINLAWLTTQKQAQPSTRAAKQNPWASSWIGNPANNERPVL